MKKIEISLQRKIAAVAICIDIHPDLIHMPRVAAHELRLPAHLQQSGNSRSRRSRRLQGPYRVVDRGED